ncbi:MAG TPA: RNase adapter RapZ [Acidimicrobiales bacterium]|nr:RNase adapter RapZ [Acidimicrobiales bacterium]
MADLLIVAGMSGAGRSTASATLEDLGWFVIDNVPPGLVTRVAALADAANEERSRLAVVIGRSGTGDVPELVSVIDGLRAEGTSIRVLFLDATDDVLIRRYEGTRRRHPQAAGSVSGAIAQEREALRELRGAADVLLVTDDLTTNELRRRITELFEPTGMPVMRTTLLSFGYKFGMPRDVDVVFDCRFLPNPHWVEALRDHSGLEDPVREYVLSNDDSTRFVDEVVAMLGWQLPAYEREGKSYLTVAFGCTGGRHRSVVIAEEVARRLGGGIPVRHRDVDR